MSVFYPTKKLLRVTGLTPEFLQEHQLSGLILDVDNTLTTHNNPDPDPQVLSWIRERKADGTKMLILSNNSEARVRPFAQRLELPFVANALKPRRSGYLRAIKALALPPQQIAAVGDQLFTDIAGGNRCGLFTVLVEPFDNRENLFIRLKRKAEGCVLRRLEKKMAGSGTPKGEE